VQSHQLHLTLVFIGEVGEPLASAVIDAARADLELEPFELSFGGLGVFPPRGAPRVLWLAIERGAREADALHRQVASRLEAAGVKTEPRPFSPHLTLARWKTARFSDRRLVSAEETSAVDARVTVEAVTLYQSQVSSSGSVYTARARACLRPPGPGHSR